MKTVFSNDEVAHIWANQLQSEGRNSQRNFYFEGDSIYSYGRHFCIAKILPSGTNLSINMKNLQTTLRLIDETLNRIQPKTMDELINVVHSVEGAGKYGTHFTIVRYMGYLQGVRVYVTGSKRSYPLPSKDKVYSVFQGIDKYEKEGYQIENQ